jgi:curli biogenesis system outer membrane secretion channel CsgG
MSRNTRVSGAVAALFLASAAIAQQPQRTAVRRLVAVLDFGYASVMTASQSIFGTNVDIGKGIADLLADRLANDGIYRVRERDAFDKIIHDQDTSNTKGVDPRPAAKIRKLEMADVMIGGDITTFGRDDSDKNVGATTGVPVGKSKSKRGGCQGTHVRRGHRQNHRGCRHPLRVQALGREFLRGRL